MIIIGLHLTVVSTGAPELLGNHLFIPKTMIPYLLTCEQLYTICYVYCEPKIALRV